MQDKVEAFQEQLWKYKELLEEEEKKKAQLKVEMVSRGWEIATMQEAISKFKKKKKVEKNKKVPKKDKVVQTKLVVGKVAAT